MILVTGANGFVGQKIMESCWDTIAAPSLRDKSSGEICRIVEESGADAIIHTAAISDIGICQSNPEASFHANVEIPLWLAEAAKGRKLVCFSSDQVYSGCGEEGPYTEDIVKAANIYAEHKLQMEKMVLDIDPAAVMLRAEWMYDYRSSKSNYLLNVLNEEKRLSFSYVQYRGVTYLKEVTENIGNVLNLPGGIYNFGSETRKSMYEITAELLKILGREIELEDAGPRHNLWMDCGKARAFGVRFSSVEEGLVKCLRDYSLVAE